MKKQLFQLGAIVALTLLPFIQTFAQVTKDEVQFVQSIWGMEKRQIVTDFMKLDEATAAKFFPIYDKYSEEMKKLGAERIAIISEYASNYTTMTDVKADELIMRLLKNNEAIDKLMIKYYHMVKKEIGGMRAAQFLQLELYLQTAIRSEIQNNIPFIGELDKLEK